MFFTQLDYQRDETPWTNKFRQNISKFMSMSLYPAIFIYFLGFSELIIFTFQYGGVVACSRLLLLIQLCYNQAEYLRPYLHQFDFRQLVLHYLQVWTKNKIPLSTFSFAFSILLSVFHIQLHVVVFSIRVLILTITILLNCQKNINHRLDEPIL